MSDDRVSEILKLLEDLDNDQYKRVAQEMKKGLQERGIVQPTPKRGRFPLRY